MDLRPRVKDNPDDAATADDILAANRLVEVFDQVADNFPKKLTRGVRPTPQNIEMVRTAFRLAYEKSRQSGLMAALRSQLDAINLNLGPEATAANWGILWRTIWRITKNVNQEGFAIEIRRMGQNSEEVTASLEALADATDRTVMTPILRGFRDAEIDAESRANEAIASARSAAKLYDDFASIVPIEGEGAAIKAAATAATANAAAARLIEADAAEAATVELARMAAEKYEGEYRAIRQWFIDNARKAAAGEP